MKIFTILYFIVVGVTLGATIYAGAVVAPVTFNTDVLFGSQVLTQFQEGMIMAKNFLRLSYALIVSAIVIAIYEILKLKNGTKDIYTLISASIVVITSLLFAFYFVPKIIQMQSLGESMTQSTTFQNIHKGSEMNVKILVFAQLFLFIRNLYKSIK
jgi:hypothetical protein